MEFGLYLCIPTPTFHVIQQTPTFHVMPQQEKLPNTIFVHIFFLYFEPKKNVDSVEKLIQNVFFFVLLFWEQQGIIEWLNQ